MRRERRMNPKCLGGSVPDTFSARSADLTGLKMRRITRAVSLNHQGVAHAGFHCPSALVGRPRAEANKRPIFHEALNST